LRAGRPDWANFGRLGDFLLWVFFENSRSTLNQFWGFFFHGKRYVFILTKMGLAPFLGDFFTNSSGHPACRGQSDK
jgi:hypothetical protein